MRVFAVENSQSVDLSRLIATLSRADVSAVLAACAARLLQTSEDPPAPASAPELLDAPAMAKRLGVPESWVRGEFRKGRLAGGKRFGRYIRFDPVAVIDSIEARPDASKRIPGRKRRGHVL
jgi:hypothetical protein